MSTTTWPSTTEESWTTTDPVPERAPSAPTLGAQPDRCPIKLLARPQADTDWTLSVGWPMAGHAASHARRATSVGAVRGSVAPARSGGSYHAPASAWGVGQPPRGSDDPPVGWGVRCLRDSDDHQG